MLDASKWPEGIIFKQKSDATHHNYETQSQGTSSSQLSAVVASRIRALRDSVDGSDGADHFGNINTNTTVQLVVVNDNKASSAIASNMDFEHSGSSTSHHLYDCDVRRNVDARNVGGYFMADGDVTSEKVARVWMQHPIEVDLYYHMNYFLTRRTILCLFCPFGIITFVNDKVLLSLCAHIPEKLRRH